ncbi:MAG TPA: chloride channel protein [Anaeromyxobacteraceae bacterium]|nr:chloride channel protein [Anaeromyxobacteraceae bacterium]
MIRRVRSLPSAMQRLVARLPSQVTALLRPSVGQLELKLLGRAIVLAAIVGLLGGLVGAAFVGAVDRLQGFLLGHLGGASMLRAAGEAADVREEPLRLWLLALLPALGGLVSGLLSRVAPEVAGGGGDGAIEAFHRGGILAPRVLPLKWLASVAALATGGAGGREGPAMHMGSAVGGLVGTLLPATPRERRTFLVAGVAAAMSAVFRTPLGAALLATEIVYRDDFEAESLVQAVIASVVAFATSEALLGQRALFGRLEAHPFHAAHLPLYAGLALAAGLAGLLLVRALETVRRLAASSHLPVWLRPAIGGLLLGGALVGLHHSPLPGLLGVSAASAVLGGGYGVAQLAVTPTQLAGWTAAGVLLTLALFRVAATALTVGTGASAGDFAPSLVIGGLVGGAYGFATQALLHDPTIAPGSFALVGMATLYAGVAHVPISAVVLVSELAGSYDLLVPLMLAACGAHVALRGVRLYSAQTTARGAAHPRDSAEVAGSAPRVRDVMAFHGYTTFTPADPLSAVLTAIADGDGQVVFPVADASGRLLGIVDSSVLLEAESLSGLRAAIVTDLAAPPSFVTPDALLRDAVAEARHLGLPQLPVCAAGRIIGMFSVEGAVRLHASEQRAFRPVDPAP